MLAWQVELGATEAICDAPVNRYEVPASPPKASAKLAKGPQPLQASEQPDPVALARRAAQSAQTLDELRAAIDQQQRQRGFSAPRRPFDHQSAIAQRDAGDIG